ncbi:copper amine oxidase [Bosea vaviloviae]|uniref:Copper amine oxidase n=1 Tax=Bosea vaviloviae TaxID=1526658 RepID=A0A1D7UB41_9HYPH|nr:copper amine oxidase [Bosea vaviloviae]
MTTYRSPTCGCCKAWVSHLEKAGFATKIIELDDLAQAKRRAGVPTAYEACHTALVDGYFIEGHVPAADITRLLAEKPRARGLAVPGMPVGSPGMEVGGATAEAFQTMLIAVDGSASVFASH